MTHRTPLLLIGSAVILLVSTGIILAQDTATPVEAEPAAVKPDMKDVSYCFGLSIGKEMKRNDVAVNVDEFVAGMRDGLAEAKPRFTDDEIRNILTAFDQELRARARERYERDLVENKKTGEAFLAKNRTAAGVKVLASGLQYKVLKTRAGKQPKLTNTVTVHYVGTLIDGTEFDSSRKRGEPAQFRVNGVIPGFSEALTLMKEGSKWQVFIPSHLAYGERGGGPLIGPNSVLIFELELIKVED